MIWHIFLLRTSICCILMMRFLQTIDIPKGTNGSRLLPTHLCHSYDDESMQILYIPKCNSIWPTNFVSGRDALYFVLGRFKPKILKKWNGEYARFLNINIIVAFWWCVSYKKIGIPKGTNSASCTLFFALLRG